MIVVLFPAMTVFALHPLQAACLFDRFDVFIGFPVRTFLWMVWVFFGRPPKVLDVMRVHTKRPVMVDCKRTPYCFVLVKIEFYVFLHLFYEFDGDLFVGVSEWAEFPVFALFSQQILLTELTFISTYVIKLLNFIMSVRAAIPHGAVLDFALDVLVFNWWRPPLILKTMIVVKEYARLPIMGVFD